MSWLDRLRGTQKRETANHTQDRGGCILVKRKNATEK